MTTTIYKVVKRATPHLFYSYFFTSNAKKIYKIGEETKADYGLLFAFDTLDHATAFLEEYQAESCRELYAIMEATTEDIPTPMMFVCRPSHFSNHYREFWNGETEFFMDAYKGTVGVKSMTLVKEIA